MEIWIIILALILFLVVFSKKALKIFREFKSDWYYRSKTNLSTTCI